MAEYVKASSTQDIASGSTRLVEVEGKRVVVANVGGEYFAFDDVCTHVGGPLSQGPLSGDVVTCPWHGSQFNVRTGEVLKGPARTAVATYEVKVEGQDIFIKLE